MKMLLKKLAKGGIALACTFLSYSHTHAQSIVPASITDQPIASATSVNTINCDMLECPLQGGVRLSAIVWSDGSGTQSNLFVDYTGNPVPVQLSLPWGAILPDVVIGNVRDSKKGTHVIGVIYLDLTSYTTYYSWYYVNGVGGPLTVSFAGTIPLSGAFGPDAKYPHIDGFADPKKTVGGLPGIFEFAATWEEHTSFSGIVTVGAIGPIENPGIVPTYQISTGTNYNEMPDVAAITDITNGNRTALFAYNHQGGLEYAEFDVASGMVTSTTMYSTQSRWPRIEAMNLYNPFNPSLTKYQIVAENWSNNDIEGNNNNYYPSVWGAPLSNANALLFPSATGYYSPAVAAGTGVGPGGNIGNQVYSMGMLVNGTGHFYGRQIDINGGTFPGTPGGNDYFEINQNPVSGWSTPLALTSSSNSGFDLLSAWFDGSQINRKFSGNVFAFKNATNVSTVGKTEMFTLSPNPAQNMISIKGTGKADYAIRDITGRLVGHGTLNGYETIVNISDFSKGMYLINIYENGNVHTSKFVKE